MDSCRFSSSFFNSPWVVGFCQGSHRWRADAIAAHVDLLGFGERLAVCAVADDVVGGEALSLVKLGRLQHSQADVDDDVRRALDGDGDQILAGWRDFVE